MAQSAPNFIDESIDRIEVARERIDDGVVKARKDLKARRKRVEKQIEKNTKSLEREFNKTRRSFAKQIQQLRKEIEKNGVVRQLTRLRSDATEQIEGALETVLGTFQIATQSDVKKLDRKLNKISKQLNDIQRRKKSRSHASA